MDFKSKLSTYTDENGNERTAIVVDEDSGSIDIVNRDGLRICQINVSYIPDSVYAKNGATGVEQKEEVLIVDVIDVDECFDESLMIGFSKGTPNRKKNPKGTRLVSVDFRRKLS